MTIEEARRVIAELAKKDNEHQFAREVLAGAWDHRSDVQAVMAGTFKQRFREDASSGGVNADWE